MGLVWRSGLPAGPGESGPGPAGKGAGQNGLLFGSLACCVLAMLEEYRMAVEWVQKEDWSALMDVLPGMEMVLTAAIFIGLSLNLAALVLHRVRRKEKTS